MWKPGVREAARTRGESMFASIAHHKCIYNLSHNVIGIFLFVLYFHIPPESVIPSAKRYAHGIRIDRAHLTASYNL